MNKSFLGLVGYFCHFVEKFSIIGDILTKLKHKDVKFIWTEYCDKVYQELNVKLTMAHVLTILISGGKLIVFTYASSTELGHILIQDQNSIAYVSRELKPHERMYHIHDLELIAIIFAFKVWRYYLFSERFDLYTDHESLKNFFPKGFEYEATTVA